jgi:2-phospho-L-lactate guanylyltransferase
MLEDVLSTLAATREFAGILVVTADPMAATIARRFGAEVSSDGAHDGHTGAVRTAAALLNSRNMGMLTVPGDIPLVTPADIRHLINAQGGRPSFTIVPARDEQGSNAILSCPADAVPLRFGENSFFPHLAAARAQGIEPRILRLPRIELDIDTSEDLAELCRAQAYCRAVEMVEQWGLRRLAATIPMRRRSA